MKQVNSEKRSHKSKMGVRNVWMLIPVIISFVLLVSCKTAMQAYYIDSNMKKIELGMSQKKVKGIAGDLYKVLESYRQANSVIDVWGYPDDQGGMYRLKFIDGVLESWDYENKRVYYKEPTNTTSGSTAE